MSTNGLNGVSCLLYSGDSYETRKTILGQGDATITHNGDPIEINNKSAGGWRVMLSDPNNNNFTTRSVDIAVSFTYMNDDDQKSEMADAAKGVTKSYIFDFGDYYYIGRFTPKINTETAVRDQAVTLDLSYMSSGEVQRIEVAPNA